MVKFGEFAESELIERILDGEKSLYEIIVRRFNSYLYKVGRSYNFSHEDTQDLMQETFIDAYKGLSAFEGRSGFKTWIIRIMLNNCYRKKGKAGPKHEITQDVNENSEPMLIHSTNDTDRIVLNRELRHTIEEALASIPFDYRMTFSLRELSGLNVSETATVLNISEANVKVRLNRAKKMLRSELEKIYSTSELFEFNLRYCDAMAKNVMEKINEL